MEKIPAQMTVVAISKPGGPEVLVPETRSVPAPGANEILIKVCQNEQNDSWAQQWSFQLRICDALGGMVPVTNVTEKVK